MHQRDRRQDWAGKKVFSTGEAAEICGVSQQTIIRSFDTGLLDGFRVPGSRYRRIPRDALLRFMRERKIKTDALESGRRILVVEDQKNLLGQASRSLAKDRDMEVYTATSGYDAGVLTDRFRPHVIVLDDRVPDINPTLLCRRVRSDPDLRTTKLLIFLSTSNRRQLQMLTNAGADTVLKRPSHPADVVPHIERLLATEDEAD